MDIVGSLPRSRSGNRYILTLCDYATRYPEAFALRNVKTRQVVNALIQLISRVGIPREILTDQGTNFTSKQLKDVFSLLGIKGLKTTPYHPQTDGLMERFKTLKVMLRRFVNETGSDWDTWLPYVLFAYREVPQASVGFSPFQLLYGRELSNSKADKSKVIMEHNRERSQRATCSVPQAEGNLTNRSAVVLIIRTHSTEQSNQICRQSPIRLSTLLKKHSLGGSCFTLALVLALK
ncbi:hypothetical protein SRHO_G00313960 [Serrasalmus rhombeus]